MKTIKTKIFFTNILYTFYIKHYHIFPKIFRPTIDSIIFPKKPNRNYDLYISLGNNCTSATTLKRLNLRTFSFPFDWLWGVPLTRNLEWILADFKGFLEYDDLFFPNKIEKPNIHHQNVKNTKTGTYFIHDFLTDSRDEFQLIKNKYDRRCSRLLQMCKDKNILFLYTEHDNDGVNYLSLANAIHERLVCVKEKLCAKSVTLILLSQANQKEDKIYVIEQQKCRLYLYKSTNTKPNNTIDRSLLALQLEEILKLIKKKHSHS